MNKNVKIREENMKIKDIENYINDDIMDELYSIRRKVLYNVTDLNKFEDYQKILKDYPVTGKDLFKMIDELPEELDEQKDEIKRKFEQHMDRVFSISDFENELFYKLGFYDGLRIVL